MIGPVIFGASGSAFGGFPVFWGIALLLAGGGCLRPTRFNGPPASRPLDKTVLFTVICIHISFRAFDLSLCSVSSFVSGN
jgi:hypothetical protein